jgi:hypothetical protein
MPLWHINFDNIATMAHKVDWNTICNYENVTKIKKLKTNKHVLRKSKQQLSLT